MALFGFRQEEFAWENRVLVERIPGWMGNPGPRVRDQANTRGRVGRFWGWNRRSVKSEGWGFSEAGMSPTRFPVAISQMDRANGVG